MTPDQFAYWLQGFAELNATAPTQEQWQAIRDHLALVFDKRTRAIDATPRCHEPPQREEPPRRHEPVPSDSSRRIKRLICEVQERESERRKVLRDFSPVTARFC